MRRLTALIPILAAAFLFPGLFVLAAEPQTYTLISGHIPFVSDVAGSGGKFGDYLKAFFNLGLGIAITLAVLMFVYNGVRYMTSDVVGKKEEAKNAFFGIIGGVILVLASVIILGAINPSLVNLGLEQTLSTIQPDSTGGGGDDDDDDDGGGQIPNEAEENTVRSELALHGITASRPCEEGEVTQDGCVTLYGLPESAIQGVIDLKTQCGDCDIKITGGVEPGHTTHGPGRPMVDLSRTPSLTTFIQTNGTFLREEHGGPLYNYRGSEYWDEPSSMPHWHVCYGTQCQFQ